MPNRRNYEWPAAAFWTGYFTQDTPGGVTERVSPEVAIARLVAEGVFQPKDTDLTAIAALATTPYGRSLLTIADAASAQVAIGALAATLKGIASGVAELDSTGKVPASQLPSFVDDVIEADTFGLLPPVGESGKIYVTKNDNKTWRWGGSAYAEISASLALGETSTTAYRGDLGKAAYDHALLSGANPHGTTYSQLISIPAAIDAIDELTPAADRIAYYTGTNSAALTPLTAFARTILDDLDAAAVRGTIGAGTSSFSGLYSALTSVPAAIDAIDALTPAANQLAYYTGASTAGLTTLSAFIRTLLDDADAATALTTLGAQPLDSDLTAIAALTTTAFGRSLLTQADAATARTTLGALATSLKGVANGLAELDATGKVPAAQLPSFVDDVVEASTFGTLPGTGESGKIYVTLDTGIVYRWSGTAYVEISASLALGTTSSTAYRGDLGNTAYTHSQIISGNPHGTTYSQLISVPAALSAIGGLTPAANRLAYYTGTTTAALATLSAFALTFLDDADAATMRTTIGAQAAGSYQPLDSDLTAIAALTTTAFGRALLEHADGAAVRSTLQLSTYFQPIEDQRLSTSNSVAHQVVVAQAFGTGYGTSSYRNLADVNGNITPNDVVAYGKINRPAFAGGGAVVANAAGDLVLAGSTSPPAWYENHYQATVTPTGSGATSLAQSASTAYGSLSLNLGAVFRQGKTVRVRQSGSFSSVAGAHATGHRITLSGVGISALTGTITWSGTGAQWEVDSEIFGTFATATKTDIQYVAIRTRYTLVTAAGVRYDAFVSAAGGAIDTATDVFSTISFESVEGSANLPAQCTIQLTTAWMDNNSAQAAAPTVSQSIGTDGDLIYTHTSGQKLFNGNHLYSWTYQGGGDYSNLTVSTTTETTVFDQTSPGRNGLLPVLSANYLRAKGPIWVRIRGGFGVIGANPILTVRVYFNAVVVAVKRMDLTTFTHTTENMGFSFLFWIEPLDYLTPGTSLRLRAHQSGQASKGLADSAGSFLFSEDETYSNVNATVAQNIKVTAQWSGLGTQTWAFFDGIDIYR